jgi:hypothetical protein
MIVIIHNLTVSICDLQTGDHTSIRLDDVRVGSCKRAFLKAAKPLNKNGFSVIFVSSKLPLNPTFICSNTSKQ